MFTGAKSLSLPESALILSPDADFSLPTVDLLYRALIFSERLAAGFSDPPRSHEPRPGEQWNSAHLSRHKATRYR